MGNISQSSKRSALKGFNVYFQHEKKMNKQKYKIQDLVECICSNPNIPNRQYYISDIHKQDDGSSSIQLIEEYDDNGNLMSREYFFNNPECYATHWVHESRIVKLINR